jgi:hypothetical protein
MRSKLQRCRVRVAADVRAVADVDVPRPSKRREPETNARDTRTTDAISESCQMIRCSNALNTSPTASSAVRF